MGAADRLATVHLDPPTGGKVVHFLLRCDKIVNILHRGSGHEALRESIVRHFLIKASVHNDVSD